MRDRVSKCWAVTITVVVGLLLISIAVRADEESATEEQALCFIKKMRGGSGRITRASERRWIKKLARYIDEADPLGRSGMSHGVILAISFHESSWRPRSIGRAGEYGLLQLLPSRLRALGLRPGEDPLDPEINLRLGIEAMRQCREECGADLPSIITCYAAGQCSADPDRCPRDDERCRARERRIESVVSVMARWSREADACASP